MKVGLLTSAGSMPRPCRQPADECGLARAEIARQQHDVASLERRAPSVARHRAACLLFGAGEVRQLRLTSRFCSDALAASAALVERIAERSDRADRSPSSRPRPRSPSARSPAAPCRKTASRQAASASSSCASHAAIIPVSTSPVPAGRHAGVAGRVDEHLPFGRRDDRAVTLQHDVDVMRRRRNRAATSMRFACTSSTDDADQPRHLAGMRRDDDVALLAAHAGAGSSARTVSASASSTSGTVARSSSARDELGGVRLRARGPGRTR